MADTAERHPRGGLYFEDFVVGHLFEHRLRRTVTQMDNMLFSNMTLNPQPLHIDRHFCEQETEWGQPLMNSLFTLGLMIGISVSDLTVGTTIANLGMHEVKFRHPLFEAETMQSIAREFGHPETVFVLKPDNLGSTARVRIFTPATELAFAGHPTVGTALVLALLGRGDAGNIVLEEKIGVIHCTVSPQGDRGGHASFLLPDLPRGAGSPAPTVAIASALGLSVNDIGFDRFVPARWSVGNAFTFVPVRNLDAIRKCRVNDAAWDHAFGLGGRTPASVFCGDTHDAA